MESQSREECVLCCRDISIYATGICDHPVCYECSARMRVLCETNECPICRSDMPLVVFTHQRSTYSKVADKFRLCNKKYNIIFEDKKALEAFELLLINKCPECPDIFPTFEKLNDHVRRKHELHYCDLCTSSLKIFTFERKCYGRHDLAIHKRKGDPDNTSHRGHPLCEFCDMRYIDYDELYRHLRREHYFCHFCDADGQHQYYRSYDHLRAHFRQQHHLCEEGDCINEKFTAVFRTEIDLKAHIATTHTRNKTKAEARQARMLDIEFSYAPHPRPTGSSSPRSRRYAQQQKRNAETQNPITQARNQPEAEPLNTECTQAFPYLSEDSSANNSGSIKKPQAETLSLQSFGRNPAPPPRRSNMMSVEDFPALVSATPSTNTHNQNKKPEPAAYRQANASNTQAPPSKKSESDNSKSGQNSTPKWLSKKCNSSNFEEEFPQLEVKKVSPPAAAIPPPLQARTVNAQNNPMPSTASSNSEPNPEFIVIKSSKSKKKKQKTPAVQEEKDDCFEKSKDSVSTFNSYPVLNNQEITRKPIRPSMPVRPPIQEPDPWETKASFRNDDFPPLEVAKRPPPGLNVKKPRGPPPGFTPNSNIVNNTSSNLSMSSIAKIVENSLKNNINSEKKVNGVHDNFSSGNYNFQDPPNFELRNEEMISTIKAICGTPENFQKFKYVSRDFRCNVISAAEYHTKCLEILGEEEFQDIFPKLVSLLPDIAKQQELLTVHTKYLNILNSNFKRRIKYKSLENNVVSCKLCSQVLLADDYNSHICASVNVT